MQVSIDWGYRTCPKGSGTMSDQHLSNLIYPSDDSAEASYWTNIQSLGTVDNLHCFATSYNNLTHLSGSYSSFAPNVKEFALYLDMAFIYWSKKYWTQAYWVAHAPLLYLDTMY